MKLTQQKILIASLVINVVLVGTGLFLAGRAYYWKAVKPTYRDYYQNKISLFRTLRQDQCRDRVRGRQPDRPVRLGESSSAGATS